MQGGVLVLEKLPSHFTNIQDGCPLRSNRSDLTDRPMCLQHNRSSLKAAPVLLDDCLGALQHVDRVIQSQCLILQLSEYVLFAVTPDQLVHLIGFLMRSQQKKFGSIFMGCRRRKG